MTRRHYRDDSREEVGVGVGVVEFQLYSSLDEAHRGDGERTVEVELERGSPVVVVEVATTQAGHGVTARLAERLRRHVTNDGSVTDQLDGGQAPHVARMNTRTGPLDGHRTTAFALATYSHDIVTDARCSRENLTTQKRRSADAEIVRQASRISRSSGVVSNNSQCQMTRIRAIARARSRSLVRRCLLGPFHGAIAVPSVTRCRCRCRRRRGHRCAGGVRQWRQ